MLYSFRCAAVALLAAFIGHSPPAAAQVPATPNIIEFYLALEGGIGASNTNFNVSPSFDVGGTSGVFGVNGGFIFPIAGTAIGVGPRVGALWGSMSGSTVAPPASPGFTYKVDTNSIRYGEVVAWWDRGFIQFAGFTRGRAESFFDLLSLARYSASLGVAWGDTGVTGTSAGFSVEDSITRSGFTTSFGVALPIQPGVDVTGQFRYINFSSGVVNIPGAVPISSDVFIGTVGVGIRFDQIMTDRSGRPVM
jgi:opacity protein-like surface antigen